jgi:hypothetical protein
MEKKSMDAVLLVGVLILNVLISIWNCYAVGTAWKDTMAMGTTFEKVLLWSGVIQSGVGFSMPILILLGLGFVAIATGGAEPALTTAEATELLEGMFSLWYIAVIFPILGSGLAIWAHSVRTAFRERDLGSFAVAGWNSYAQVHNTLSAMNNLGGAFGDVGKLFGSALGGKGDGKGKLVALVIVLVIIALVAGFMIAFSLVRYFAGREQSRIEQYGESLRDRHSVRA